MRKSAETWHVVTMDRHVSGPLEFQEAVEYCRTATLDPRKEPRLRQHSAGCFEFIEHRGSDRRGGFHLVNGDELPNWSAAHEQLVSRSE